MHFNGMHSIETILGLVGASLLLKLVEKMHRQILPKRGGASNYSRGGTRCKRRAKP